MTILSPIVPVCTDLLTIGAGTIIRKASSFTCYRADDGLIQTGPVSIGRDAFVGEATVLDIGSSLGDGAQLGHTSSLHAGQAVPAGQRWHGSPAEPTAVNYRQVPAAGRDTLRRLAYTSMQLVVLFGVVLPAGLGGLALLVSVVPQLDALLGDGPPAFMGWTFYRDALYPVDRAVRRLAAARPGGHDHSCPASCACWCGRTRSTACTASATGPTGRSAG